MSQLVALGLLTRLLAYDLMVPEKRSWLRVFALGLLLVADDPDADQAAAFRDYVHALHEWRKLPSIDPGLPPELLPDDWEGTVAVTLFFELRSRLEQAAKRYVVRIVGGG